MNFLIATRQSPLALKQAQMVVNAINQLGELETPDFLKDFSLQLHPIKTQADQRLDKALYQFGGKGLFLKELEQSLIKGETHLAVHSLKDVPADMDEHFQLSAFTPRHHPQDCLVLSKEYLPPHFSPPFNAPQCFAFLKSLTQMKPQFTLATSSFRRQSQIAHAHHKFCFKSIRGNINTRLNTLVNQQIDGLLLAKAGLERLDLMRDFPSLMAIDIPTSVVLPAVGQGVLVVQTLTSQATKYPNLFKALHLLNDPLSELTSTIERHIVQRLGAQCLSTLAVFAHYQGDAFYIEARAGSLGGKHQLHSKKMLKLKPLKNIQNHPLIKDKLIHLADEVALDLKEQGVEQWLSPHLS